MSTPVPAVDPTGRSVRRPSLRRRSRRALAALTALIACAGLTACSGTTSGSSTAVAATAKSSASVPAGLASYYGQKVSWYPCGDDNGIAKTTSTATKKGSFTCAKVKVPLDYAHPSGETITLALKKRAASKTSIGTLFVNPGGPGGSGVELVGSVQGYFNSSLTDSYDIIGFDPRGVGDSTAVDCLTDSELDAERAGTSSTPLAETTSSAAAQAEVVKEVKALAKECSARTKPAALLDHIDTVSAAKDLDILRAVAGQSALTYLGYSYGTYLGATYAELFPSRVGRMVLDGAIDPSLSAAQLTQGQAEGFEKELRTYVAQCQSGSDCPLSGGTDKGIAQIRSFLKGLQSSPIKTSTSSRPLTYELAETAIIDVLYQSESWSVLTQALTQAMKQDDGSMLLYIADVFADRNDDGTYSSNGDEAMNPINCLDYPVEGDAATWAKESAALKKASPTFGADLGYSDLYCKTWGRTSTRARAAIHAKGAAPILVVGTTNDPATPYAWAQSLAKQLDSGRLLTWKGNGHTAYGRAGSCLTKAVDKYLLTGTEPATGTVCTG